MMSLPRRVEIYEQLKKKLRKLESGYYEYLPETSDATIAAEFGVHFSSVQRIRRQLFGDLRRGPTPAPKGSTLTRNEALAALSALYELEDRVNAMEAQLQAAFGLKLPGDGPRQQSLPL